jgi:hypothetical protein
VLQVVQRVVTRHLLVAAGLVADEGHGGAVTLIQRFGSAANLNIHLHCLVLDGAYRCDADGVPGFIEARAPTDDEFDALLHTIIARLMKMLTRRGVLVEGMGQTYLAEPDADGEEARTLRPLQVREFSDWTMAFRSISAFGLSSPDKFDDLFIAKIDPAAVAPSVTHSLLLKFWNKGAIPAKAGSRLMDAPLAAETLEQGAAAVAVRRDLVA